VPQENVGPHPSTRVGVTTDIQPLGTASAGATGRIADAGHVHPAQTGLPPSGDASGDLGGSYPAPTVTATHLVSPLPVAQGGTGSGTQTWVDLTTTQTVAGVKTFSSAPVVPAGAFPEAAVSGLAADLAARLAAASNLADVANASTALANLGGVAKGALVLNARDYGAKATYATSTSGAMTASSAVLTDTNAAFTAADIGKVITVVGAGAAGVDLSTTIASQQSTTQVTLTAAASTTVSGAMYGFGTDDSAAINATITAAGSVGATVYLPPGRYALGSVLVPASNVAIVGAGIGATTLFPFGTVSAVQLQATTGNPLTGFTLAHLTIDGARQVGPFAVSIKGVFIQYCAGCTFEDLIIQNCVATGLGADFLTLGTVIHAVRAINNGRLNQGGGNGAGSNGIGVGTGQHPVEQFSISQCYAYGNGRYGIMLESQTGTTSTGIRIVGCWSQANGNHGYGDAGGNGAIWSGCVAYANTIDGFSVDNGTVGATAVPGGNTLFVGCSAVSNTRYGFSYQPTAGVAPGAGNITYVGCKAVSNTSLGFNSNSITSHPVSGLTYLACEAYSNGASGLQIQNPMTDLKVSNCKFNANGQVSSTSKTGIQLGANITGLQIEGCRIYDDGGTQKQTYGIVIPAGTTITTGHIASNDLRGNLTGTINLAGTLTAVVCRGNVGYTATITQPGVPATTVAYTNQFGVDCMAYINTGTVTAIAVNGIATGEMSGGFLVRALDTITLTYTVAPTWVWIPQG
jgi:hypothetical protein